MAAAGGRNQRFVVRGGYVGDCDFGGVVVTRSAGTGVTTGVIEGVRIGRPNIATPRGIYVSHPGTVEQVVLDIIDPRIDSQIAAPFDGLASATVTQRHYTAPLVNAANDAAAAAAGVGLGQHYRNGSDLQVRVV